MGPIIRSGHEGRHRQDQPADHARRQLESRHGSVVTLAHVFLSAPDELHGLVACHRDCERFANDLLAWSRVRSSASAGVT